MLTPVIAPKNCFKRSGDSYRAPKWSPPAFASFCISPVRSASVNEPQKGYNRALAISSRSPTYEGLLVAVTIEHAERFKRVEKIACAALVESKLARESRAVTWPLASAPNTSSPIALSSVFDPRTPYQAA
jgi:hypothetical protein